MNDIKTFTMPKMAGLRSPDYTTGQHSTSILVTDRDGVPLVGAHLTYLGGGVITGADGEGAVTVPSTSTVITISYVGKRSYSAKFSDLVNAAIALQDEVGELDPVIIGGGTKPNAPKPPVQAAKKTSPVTIAVIGIAAILLIKTMSSDKKGLNAPKPKKKKPVKKTGKKTKSKAKKSKGLRQPVFIEL